MRRVLVIDDSSSVRQQVRTTLVQGGFDVLEGCDGVDGLEKLRGDSDVRLILCDINMPRMNGLEFISECQRTGVTVPILMLTSEAQPSIIRRAREAGVKGWIVKPFNPDLLVTAVTKILAASAPGPATPAPTA